MQLLHALAVFCSLPQFATLVSAENTNPSAERESKETNTRSLPAKIIIQRNAAIASQLASGPALGVKKMSENEGEKFFLDYWSFGEVSSSSNISERHFSEEEGFSPARFVAQSYPFGPSYSSSTDGYSQYLPRGNKSANNLFEKRDFKCPTGTLGCTSIGRSDRCCGSGETCEIVADTGNGDVGCCPSWQTCSGTIGSCESGYTACSQALGGGCCIPGYDCVEGGCAYVTVITVTLHSTVMLSTVTYSTKPDSTSTSISTSTSTSSTISSQSGTSTTDESLAPPARPTNLSTVTSDVCPTGFYACSAVYQGGCCRTGRDCDTTSCPTTSSTTMTSDGVTIVAPVATTTERSGGNLCAQGWFRCADTVGGGCCPTGFACGSSCTATDTASATTVTKEQATATAASGYGVAHRISKMMLGMTLGMCVGFWML